MKVWDFTEGEGLKYVGQHHHPQYPDRINVSMPRKEAFAILAEVAEQLRDEETDTVSFSISGTLTRT